MSAPRPRATLRRKLLAAAISLGVCLFAAELVVRARYGAPLSEHMPILEVRANPYRGWEMVPGKAHYTYWHHVAVNSLGLRGPEIADKRPGETRVLALGDSLVYGQGVSDSDTLPAQLQRELGALADKGQSWTVVNAGLRAYDTRQELGLLDELGAKIAPDVVIVFWFRNDFIERDIDGTYQRLKASGPIAFDLGEPAEGWALWKWRLEQVVRHSALVMKFWDALKVDQVARVDDAIAEKGLERLRGYLERFKRAGAELGFLPLLAVVPVPDAVASSAPDRGPAPRVLALAAELAVPAIDLLGPLRAEFLRTGRLPIVRYDGHYDPEGNGAMASAVAAFVRAEVELNSDSRGEDRPDSG